MSKRLTVVLAFALLVVSSMASSATIADVKLAQDGEQVTLTGKAVTYASTDLLYVEEDDRSCGIRVEKTAHGLRDGIRADISGFMSTGTDGERCILAAQASRNGTSTVSVCPLLMTGCALGGSDWHCTAGSTAGQKCVRDGVGLNNIGLLARISGRITYADPAGAFAYIDDGSASSDGNTLGPEGSAIGGVRVLLSGSTSPTVGSNVSLTGVSSTARVGGLVVRALRMPPSTYTGEMVYVPAGAFLMGNTGIGKDVPGYAHEKPQHQVYLSAYSIGKHEVTRGEYKRFMQAGGYTDACRWCWSDAGWAWKVSANRTQPQNWDAVQYIGDPPGPFTQTDKHPVGGVNYYESEAFCRWAGGHLPTEAQWEKAARWDGAPRVYPWGNTYDGSKCNAGDDGLYPGCQTAPVGMYSGASPYGCRDMAGNVFEWVQDWYSATYYSQTPTGGWIDPQGPTTGDYRILRGGCWYSGYDDCRCAYREYSYADHVCFGWLNAGFRMAR